MKKYLFFIEREFHIAIFKNLILEIKKKEIGQIGILTTIFTDKSGKKNFGIRKKVLENHLGFLPNLIENPYEYNPDFTFTADSSYEKIEGLGRIVSLGHGTICKGSFYTDTNLSYRENCADIIFTPGAIHKDILKKYVSVPIFVSGIPKLDQSKRKINKTELLTSLKLDPHKKTILIAPTFNKELSLISAIIDEIREYFSYKYNLIFKLHGVETKEIINKVKQFCKTDKDSFYWSSYDISLAYTISDLLISDVSSVIYEFISYNKPVILFNNPRMKKFKNFNPNNLEYKFRNIGLTFSNPMNLPDLINKTFSQKPLLENREKVAKLFVKNPDNLNATEFIFDKLEKLKFRKRGIIILIKGIHSEFLKFIYSKKYDIVEIENRKEIEASLKKLRHLGKNVIVIDGKYKYSAFYPDFLSIFLYRYPNAIGGCLFDKMQVHKTQDILNYFPMVDGMSNNQIAQSISYQKPGVYDFVNYIGSETFGISSKLLKKLNDFYFVNTTYIKADNHYQTAIILDSYMYNEKNSY